MKVNRSGHYAWLHQPKSKRDINDQRLTGLVKQPWLESGGNYGYRNITVDMKERGESCRKNRVLTLMRKADIQALRGYKKPGSYQSGQEPSCYT